MKLGRKERGEQVRESGSNSVGHMPISKISEGEGRVRGVPKEMPRLEKAVHFSNGLALGGGDAEGEIKGE